MVIDDHINLMGANPLVGINDDRLGPRFPDMCRPYDPALDRAGAWKSRGARISPPTRESSCRAGTQSRNSAEYRFLRPIGADAVGMSTVPEVIVAVHCGLRVLGCSIVTDVCLPDALEPVDMASDHRHGQSRRAQAAQDHPGRSGTRTWTRWQVRSLHARVIVESAAINEPPIAL